MAERQLVEVREVPLPPFLAMLGPSMIEVGLLNLSPEAAPGFLGYLPQRAAGVQTIVIQGNPSEDASSMISASSFTWQLNKLTSLTIQIHILDTGCMEHHITTSQPQIRNPAELWKTLGQYNWAHVFSAKGAAVLSGLFEAQNDMPRDYRTYTFSGISVEPRKGAIFTGYIGRPCTPRFCRFRPLMQGRNLQRFQLKHPCGVSVTVLEVGELLDAWPGIDSLNLQYKTYENDPELLNRTNGLLRPSLLVCWTRWPRKYPKSSTSDSSSTQLPRLTALPENVSDSSSAYKSLKSHCQLFVSPKMSQRSKSRFPLQFDLPQQVQEEAVRMVCEDEKKWDQVDDYLKLLFDQRERLERDFKLVLNEERARHNQEFREVAASTTSIL
ncbi:hypothetical protein M407DRAFT_19542 [Tulasnella calospora MUT 4182]|uniref:Uncharacterized protein n=1 Tax=Tulasnella calospora MUT 4182 TaxID=1051891 RepID=A0A0C3MCD1_9AGAM|nr:hypothetical protein M407DRAFT_19542 [Tulasnella calospora MUT 4182]